MPKQFNEEKNVFQTNGDGTNGYPHGRNESQSLPYNMLENYVKWFIQNKETKAMPLWEENLKKTLSGKRFSRWDSKNTNHGVNFCKLDSI